MLFSFWLTLPCITGSRSYAFIVLKCLLTPYLWAFIRLTVLQLDGTVNTSPDSFFFYVAGKTEEQRNVCVTGVAGWWLSQDQRVLRLPSKLSALFTAQVVSFHRLLHWSLSPSKPLSGKSVHLTQQFQFLLCFWVSGLGRGGGKLVPIEFSISYLRKVFASPHLILWFSNILIEYILFI